MRKIVFILTLFTMTLSSFTRKDSTAVQPPFRDGVEKLTARALDALRRSSQSNYLSLYPSLDEFHDLMEKNKVVYGNTLREAKLDFTNVYQRELVPALKQSFDDIIVDGEAKGIQWSRIHYIHTVVKAPDENGTNTIVIVFTSGGKEYSLHISRAIEINGEWKLSQYAALI